MGMNVATMPGSAEPQPLMEVNTTPLIDVMLVLLVMLIITIPTQLHSINLDINGETTHPPKNQVVHTVAIDFDGTVIWDGQALASPDDVEARLREVGAMAEADQPEVHVQPNKLADYGSFATVMAAAQRHNVKRLGMVGNERFNR